MMFDLSKMYKAIKLAIPERIFMCDIETLALKEDAKVLSIGGLVFNPAEGLGGILDENGKIVCPHFEVFISLDGQEDRYEDPETRAWWMKQSEDAKRLMFGPETCRMSLKEGLDFMLAFLEKTQPTHGSANSPSFDFNIIKDAMRPYALKMPIPFWNEIDYRSLESFVFGQNVRREGYPFHYGDKHTALDDSVSQALAMCFMYQWRREVAQAYGGSPSRGG